MTIDAGPVDLDELDRNGVVRELTDRQAELLAGTRLVQMHRAGETQWRLVPNGRVGAIRAGTLEIRVKPKVGIARLMFLLGYAKNPGFRPETVSAVAEADLWPAVAETLARQIEHATRPGILLGYTTIDDALPVVRGRIRIADQNRRPGLPLPLQVSYDERTADIPENQILRTALRRMMAVPRLSDAVLRRLSLLERRFDAVTPLPAGRRGRWHPNRLNTAYVPALRLAEIILEQLSVEYADGDLVAASFVVNMPLLFEQFVGTALRETLHSRPGTTTVRPTAFLDTDDAVTIEPDVVYSENGRPEVIFDAKYKLERETGGFPNADLYQMLGYCTALDVTRGLLIYAHGLTQPNTRRIRNTRIDVIQHPLDLTAPPARLLESISQLAMHATSPVEMG